MKTEVKNINPELARFMLTTNSNNRNCSDNHVNFLAAEMSNNHWVFDGQPIRFSLTGQLLDGQHRLNAIIKSNTTQSFLIITGIADDAFKVMDTGKNRSGADALKINGIHYATDVAACSRMIMHYRTGSGADKGGRKSNSDIIDWYYENENIIEHIKNGHKWSNMFSNIMSRSEVATFSFLLSEVNANQSDLFLSRLCTGLDLDANSPIFILRKRLIDDKMSTTRLRISDKKAFVIKAWNAFRLNKPMMMLKWNRDKEPFPSIL